METIRLPLRYIQATAEAAVLDERRMTPEEVEEFENCWWEGVEHFPTHQLPTLGEQISFPGFPVVVDIRGRRFKVDIDFDYDDPSVPDGKFITLTETGEPLTPPTWGRVKFFGQPHWIQGEFYPADPRGRACFNLFTIENCWGDNGNQNVLIGLDDDGLPDVAYFEASCH